MKPRPLLKLPYCSQQRNTFLTFFLCLTDGLWFWPQCFCIVSGAAVRGRLRPGSRVKGPSGSLAETKQSPRAQLLSLPTWDAGCLPAASPSLSVRARREKREKRFSPAHPLSQHYYCRATLETKFRAVNRPARRWCGRPRSRVHALT